MRWIADGEDWTTARTQRAQRRYACVFCGDSIRAGQSYARWGTETAHYACAPGLGAPTYRASDWTSPAVGSYSLIGGREENQDAMAWHGRADRVRLMVCDGLGGHRGGREAAQTAVAGVEAPGAPVEVVQAVDAAVRAAGPGGTTFCMAEVLRTAPHAGVGEGRAVRFTQVGDSTAWLRRVQSGKSGVWKDEVRGRTVRQGQGCIVYACLGTPNGRFCADPTVTSFVASPGDIVVVHTDGVDLAVEQKEWAARFASRFGRTSIDEVAAEMAERAAALGSTDNATVLVFVVP